MTTYSNFLEANRARQVEWDKDSNITLAYRGNELAGEVGELCNVIKKLERERIGIRGSRASKDDLEEELGDAIICLYLIGMHMDIDPDKAARKKFNKTSEKYGLQTRVEE